jgi:hypothetical protein
MRNNEQREKKDRQDLKNNNPRVHKGGPSASSKKTEPHRKDESNGASENTSKKHGNSI